MPSPKRQEKDFLNKVIKTAHPSKVVKTAQKTTRTHEENQERAYIAASRRSDRSLEARIESARRASEIHKKRTGRGLRVTEDDVVNEEMYEEEDDDLPTQYQRLNAHLQTSSMLFNRKLHDYIVTQTGVRNMFLNQQFPGYQRQFDGSQFQLNAHHTPNMAGSMLPPQAFNATTSDFSQQHQQNQQPQQHQQTQHYQQNQQPQQLLGPQEFQGYRHSPYNVPRPHPHQRSASIAGPYVATDFAPLNQFGPGATTPGGEANRRQSLPHHALGTTRQTSDGLARPPLSRTSTERSVQQQSASPHRASASPSTSTETPPQMKSEHPSPSFHMGSMSFGSSQGFELSPLSMTLPPESQQLVGSALDPNDPRTSLFMSGSENLPQPYSNTYTYNPNLSPKSRVMASGASQPGITQTLAPEHSMRLVASSDPPSKSLPSASDDQTFAPFDYSMFSVDDGTNANDFLSFVNWDQ